MACNRNRLHYQFNRNQWFLLPLEFFALCQCTMNRSFGGSVSTLSLVIKQWRMQVSSQFICTDRRVFVKQHLWH